MRSIVLTLALIAATACRTTAVDNPDGSVAKADEDGAVLPGPCLFGETLEDLEVSPDFRTVVKGEERRKPRVGDETVRSYSIIELRRTGTGERYSLYTADSDEAASGWIEDQAGKIVGEIREGQIVACTLAEPIQAQVTDESCLFGTELASLLGLGQFTVKPEADGRRESPLPADGRANRNVHVRSLTHGKTAARFTLYALKENGRFASDATGWIETPEGVVVAQFGVGEIYRCDVGPNGTPRRTTAGKECGFGTDLQDLISADEFSLGEPSDVTSLPKGTAVGGDSSAQRRFAKRTVKHVASEQTFSMFLTSVDVYDEAAGWIENSQGEVVAEVTDTGFRNCKF